MKNLLPIILTIVCFKSQAQAPFPTIDSINVNNINAAVLVHGDMWWNPVTEVAHCNFPANSRKNVNFAGCIWLSGYDGSGQLHVAAQTYRQSGNDFWPGPLDAADTLTYATSAKWAKIWKVNRSDIQEFQLLPTHTTSNTPGTILTWPGKGNANAIGATGSPLTITNDMAPFVDLNGNGIYEPLLGDFPDVPGDQALWWVFSDNGPAHAQTHGKPLGVEVHAMAYGYSRGTTIDDVVYYDYQLVNRSANDYNNVRIAQWDDIDLGYYLDDYIGFDSTWRMGICYNGTNSDGSGAGGPAVNSYGGPPPQSAVTMIALPGDAGTNYVPAGSFTTYNNDISIIGNPSNDTQCNFYMRSRLAGGVSIASAYSTGTPPCGGFSPTANINYLYPGDPSDNTQWSECACNYVTGNRRFILSSNDFTLNAGSTQRAVFALIVADSAGGCGVAGFSKIRTVADTAWNIYYHPLPPKPLAINDPPGNLINIYPNPAHDKLIIENKNSGIGEESITIYNAIGQMMRFGIEKNNNQSRVDISHFPGGVYHIIYREQNEQKAMTFVKE